MAQDPYKELGVSRGASAAELRKAFHKLAKKHHPDANPGDKASEETFKRVSGAFDLLGDPEKRRRFDAGEIDADGRDTARAYAQGPFGQSPFGSASFSDGPGGGRGATFDGIDLNDILGDMFGARAGSRPGPFAARGADLRARLEIDLEESIAGAKKRIPFGDGRTLDVAIPKGVAEGQTLRLKGQGGPGRGGPGDALIEIVIRPHPIFRREGDHLAMDLPISVPDAVLGGKTQAETPDGPVTLAIPKGSNSGATLRLKGRGLSDAQGRRGDLMARLVVTLPEAGDPELEALAETWRRDRPYSPRRRR